MASAAEDMARLLVSIEAKQRDFQKQLAAIARSASTTAGGIERDFQKANDNAARSFDSAGRKVTASIGQQRAAVQNLSFQLNDIATSLSGGASPFQVMMQQGSQVAQALGSTGGGLGGVVKTLGGAFASMVNPVSLASFALIGLTGAAVQYFSTLSSDVPDADTLLKQHGDVIKSFDAAWGIASEGVKQYSEATRLVELQKLKDEFGDLSKVAAGAFDELTHGLRQIPASDFGSASLIDQTNKAMALLEQEIPALREFAAEMVKIENAKDVPTPIREAAEAARKLAQPLFEVQDSLMETQERLKTLRLTVEQGKDAFAALTAAAVGLGPGGGDAVSIVANKIKSELIPATNAALQQLGEFVKSYNAMIQEQVNKDPLGQLSPVFSGAGQFLNSDGNPLMAAPANDPRWAVAGESAAAQMVKGFENFISKAKWDVNAFRVGFGSDTVTRANGTIEKVTKDTVVTLDDAQRDLSRRLVEFQDGIRSAIGIETWKSLNDAQQAALTSIAYNYGSLPKLIVNAIQSGGGSQAVAQAIAALGSDNGGINKGRRNQEAQSYLSGSGMSLGQSGLGASGKTPSQIFEGSMEQVQRRIDLLNAEYAAQSRLNPLIDDYGFAVEKARIEQQLLADAQRAGVEITPALRDSIGQLAENYARAKANSEEYRASQERTLQAAQAFGGIGKDVVGGFIRDLRNGTSAADAFANAIDKITDRLIDMMLNAAFDGGGLGQLFKGFGAGFGGFSPAGKIGLFDRGGYTGDGGKYEPAGIVHKGEYVFDADATRRIGAGNLARLSGYANGGLVGGRANPALGGDAGPIVKVNIINNSGSRVTQKSQETSGGMQLDVMIDEVVADKLSTPGSLSRSAAQSSFGLRPGLARR